jgi:hypothetical protein
MKSIWLWFWIVTGIGCFAWYVVATFYIAVRGALDIRGMLAQLKQDNAESQKE